MSTSAWPRTSLGRSRPRKSSCAILARHVIEPWVPLDGLGVWLGLEVELISKSLLYMCQVILGVLGSRVANSIMPFLGWFVHGSWELRGWRLEVIWEQRGNLEAVKNSTK